MDSLRLYNVGTSALLLVNGLPLLFTPGMMLYMLSSNPTPVSTIETFLARSASLAYLLSAFLNLLFSGEIQRLYGEDGLVAKEMDAPYAQATLYMTLLYHIGSGIMDYSYSYSTHLSSTMFTLGSLSHLLLAAGGILLLMFGQGPKRISKRTGADKRTSGFPFKNVEADKRKAR